MYCDVLSHQKSVDLTKYLLNEELNERQSSGWQKLNKESVNCFGKKKSGPLFVLLGVNKVSGRDLNVTDQSPSWEQPRDLGSTVFGDGGCKKGFFSSSADF